MDAAILNHALDMTLEWGENFHKPVQERLRHAYPALSQVEADELDRFCREIMYYAFGQVERAYIKEITDQEATANILARCPLVNQENLSRLWTQGQYYAWKDNG